MPRTSSLPTIDDRVASGPPASAPKAGDGNHTSRTVEPASVAIPWP